MSNAFEVLHVSAKLARGMNGVSQAQCRITSRYKQRLMKKQAHACQNLLPLNHVTASSTSKSLQPSAVADFGKQPRVANVVNLIFGIPQM